MAIKKENIGTMMIDLFNWKDFLDDSVIESSRINRPSSPVDIKNINPADVSLIIERCKVMNRFVNFQEELSYSEWFLGLGILHYCKDAKDLIHYYSSMDSRYKPREVDKIYKSAMKKGIRPVRCNTLKRENFELCNDCVFQGLIDSPIRLGYKKTKFKNTIEISAEVFEKRLYATPLFQDFYHNRELTFKNDTFKFYPSENNVIPVDFNASSRTEAIKFRNKYLLEIFSGDDNDIV
jgi:hypothetical protein